MRPHPILVSALATSLAGALLLAGSAGAGREGPAAAWRDPLAPVIGLGAAPEPPAARLAPAPVDLDVDHFWSWALLDLASGEVVGSPNLAEVSTTASMIKVWLAADLLRRLDEAGAQPTAERLGEVEAMIRDSDNDPATALYEELAGAESIGRLIDLCGLTDSMASWRWSLTLLSARDAARMAACVVDGRAAGPWTDWLLTRMRQVRGDGDFGIREAFVPAARAGVAIKNGWFPRPEDGMWHLNCLAAGDGWALAVLQRYPEELGREHGAANCARVAAQLRVDPDPAG